MRNLLELAEDARIKRITKITLSRELKTQAPGKEPFTPHRYIAKVQKDVHPFGSTQGDRRSCTGTDWSFSSREALSYYPSATHSLTPTLPSWLSPAAGIYGCCLSLPRAHSERSGHCCQAWTSPCDGTTGAANVYLRGA